MNKQDITICADCLKEFNRLIGYPSRLVVADKVTSAEDEIIAACEATASKTTIDSIPLLDFYRIATQAFETNRDVELYFDYNIGNINKHYRKLWPIRYFVFKTYGF